MRQTLGVLAAVSSLVLVLGIGIVLTSRAYAEDGSLPPAVAWPTGPLDVVVALPSPLDPARAQGFVGRSITFSGPPVGQDSKRPAAETPGVIRIAGARLADGGRTLLLATD